MRRENLTERYIMLMALWFVLINMQQAQLVVNRKQKRSDVLRAGSALRFICAWRAIVLPMTFRLTAGQRHEATQLESLMEQGAVKRLGFGRPRVRPQRVVGDKAYSSGKIRRYLRRRGICLTIPRKRNERRTGSFDRAIYRQRNRVERAINRLKQFRRVATRYEKRAENYLAMLTIAAIVLWL